MLPSTITSSGLVTHFEVADFDFSGDPCARKVTTRDDSFATIIAKLVVGWHKSQQRDLNHLKLGKGA